MRRLRYTLERHALWLRALLGLDVFCAAVLWVSDVRAFQALIVLIVLTSALLAAALLAVLDRRSAEQRALFQALLSDPSPGNEERLLRAFSREEGESIRLLAAVLRTDRAERSELSDGLRDYEEYVEGWAHEAKTPLSLLTMLIDNHGGELSPSLHTKLDYVRHQLQAAVTQMLYYARLKSSTKDHRFEDVPLHDCLAEVLEDYAPLLQEKRFVIHNSLRDETVYTDRRGLRFMLGQIISNAIQYSGSRPELTVRMTRAEGADILSIQDNGAGVKEYDLPYIFQKGFTGESTGDRKKATGMGLYLAQKMADELSLRLEASSRWSEGFRMDIIFPH